MGGIEAIEVWRVKAMLEYIKHHTNPTPPKYCTIEEICDNYLKFIEEEKFIAYE